MLVVPITCGMCEKQVIKMHITKEAKYIEYRHLNTGCTNVVTYRKSTFVKLKYN